MDGALYCFVSRDCEKMKLLRFDLNGWCMYYVRLSEGGFKWRHSESGELLPHIERRQLLWLLEEIPNAADSGDPAYLDSLMPWSESVPPGIRLEPAAAEKAAEMADDPIIDMDPSAFSEDEK